jgi:3'(2'), 5'-bisphosphate nucleotidase
LKFIKTPIFGKGDSSTAMREIIIDAALLAGREILKIRASYDLACSYKIDDSPVTIADQRSEAIIIAALERELPHIPIIAEERVSDGEIPAVGATFFLIDPLDGTKEFVAGKQDFTVNIALIVNGVPTMGIVYAPALNVAWIGCADFCHKLTISEDFTVSRCDNIASRVRPTNLVAVISRSHCNKQTDDFVADNGLINSISIGSSLKFCMLAEGLADVYPRFSRTMQWDTAAGDAVLRAAGGIVLQLDGAELTYGYDANQLDTLANPHFIAWGRKE